MKNIYPWAEKVILVDYDGVMVNFTQSFDFTMHELGYSVIRDDCYSLVNRYDADSKTVLEILDEFVHGPEMRLLPQLDDSIYWVRALREEGFLFHCITSVPFMQYENRIANAEGLYGHGIFQRLECIGVTDSKADYLKRYAGTDCFWIEDKPENALLGLDYGLKPLLMHHEYNRTFDDPRVQRVRGWKEVYETITNEL